MPSSTMCAARPNDSLILSSCSAQLGRPPTESILAEVNQVYNTVKEMVAKLPKWAKPEAVHTELNFKLMAPKVYKEPKGKPTDQSSRYAAR